MGARAIVAMGLGWLGDAGGALLIGLAVPVGILVVGMPIAVVVRLLIELVARF
jgi:hypothetical protein